MQELKIFQKGGSNKGGSFERAGGSKYPLQTMTYSAILELPGNIYFCTDFTYEMRVIMYT